MNPWIQKYLNQWGDLDINKLELMLTRLFTYYIENWGMSPDIFENLSDATKSNFFKSFEDNLNNIVPELDIKFNLFEKNNYGT